MKDLEACTVFADKCMVRAETMAARHAAFVEEMEGVAGQMLSLPEEVSAWREAAEECRYLSDRQPSSCLPWLPCVKSLCLQRVATEVSLP